MLAGYGIKALTESAQKKAFASFITIFSIILICLDFHIFPKVGLCKFNSGNRTYDYIVKSAPNDPLLEIPLWPGESSWSTVYQYYTTIYRVPIVNGYSPFVTKKYIDKIFWPLVSINMGMINEDQYKLLKSLGIKYINMHEEAYPYKVSPFPFKTALKNMEQSPYVKFIIQDGPIYLFQILDPPLTNIAQNIYTIPAKTGVFYECENMPHRFGQNVVDKSASNNLALHADTLPSDDTRHFIFGPWQMFPPGKYTMLFRMKINPRNTENKTDDKLAAIEITTENGNSRIAYKDITLNDCAADYKDYSIDFTLDKLAVLEFRVLYLGECYISADYIYLTTADTKDPICSYKAEDLFHTGREKDGAAFVDPTLDPGGNFVFGPYRRYPEGKYKIGYSIKSGRPSPDNSAVISVVTGHGTIPLAKMELSNIPAEYKAYWLEIELDKPTVLEFKVDFLKVVPIYFKSVEVKNE
jgi:hypothetical protein